ncbi:MAG: NAD-dependent epimerase/dehydratase family protein [Methanococcaceae archaeon]
MKIFITGATGFIGNHLVKRLFQTEHRLYCLVRKTSIASEQLKKMGATIIIGDITDKVSILRAIKGCDWVFHLAGQYSFWEPNNNLYYDINVNGTRNVMECALETNISKVVHVSTVGIYGKPVDCPFTEESKEGPVRFCVYFQTKYLCEQIVWDLLAKRGLPVVVVYPSAVLGPDDPKATGQYFSNFIHRKLPGTVFEDSILTFVYVKDVAEVIVRAAEKQNNIGEKYLIGKYRLSFREINKMLSEISGVAIPKSHFPDTMTMFNAVLLTGLANLIKKSPPLGMSIDQMKVMREGFQVDGSKAERELGIIYTPIRNALQEVVESMKTSKKILQEF